MRAIMTCLATLGPEARLAVSALLNRIVASPSDRLPAEEALELWRCLPPPAPGAVRLDGLRAGAWALRRFRAGLRWVVEVERLGGGGGPRLRFRYGLFGGPVDLMRHAGRRVAFRPWPGLAISLDLGAWRPWKLAAAAAGGGQG
jgi:hypothetical protein